MRKLAPYLAVGRIVKPQGIKGELKVSPLADDPNRFFALGSVFLSGKDGFVERHVAGVRLQDHFAYVKLSGVDDRNAAEAPRDQLIHVRREDAAPLPPGRYYICDIIGCRVVDRDGRDLGEITDVIQTGSNDVYVVKDKDEWMLPALKSIILSYNMDQGRVLIDKEALPEVDPDAY